MKRVLGAALTATMPVLLAASVNLATGSFDVSLWWAVGSGLIVLILTGIEVVLKLRQGRGDELPGPQLTAPDVLHPIVGMLPPRAANFQERRVLAELAAAGSAVLSGPAGVGKTQLAVEYARTGREGGHLDKVFWIDARSRGSILSSLAEAARLLLRTDGRDPLLDVALLLAWLATTTQPWLIVLDDMRDADDLKDLWPPHSQYGRVVVTAQSPDAAVCAIADEVISVGHFTPDESLAFLAARLARSPEQAEGAAALAAALDHHPLALAQAAAFIADHGRLTCAAYQVRFADREYKLSHLQPDRMPDGYRGTITTTLSLSIDRANNATPRRLARPLLELVALLDPNGIPESVFISAAAIAYADTTGRGVVSADDVRDALFSLARFELITYEPDSPNRTVRVHALVQRAVDETLGGRTPKAAHAAANALLQAWPTIARDTDRAAVMRANATALRTNPNACLWHRRAREVLFRTGLSLGETGRSVAARDYFQELVDRARVDLRDRDPAIRKARHGLGHWTGEAGDPAGARAIYDEELREAQRRYGRANKFTLDVHRHRARWRADAGDPVGARDEMAELVKKFRRAFGPDHPQTLYARNMYARLLCAAGNPRGAGNYMVVLVDDFVRVLDPEHPDTLSARNNLAGFVAQAGNPRAAVVMYVRLLPDLIRVIGPDDPRTLRTRNNLARSRDEAGDPSGAIPEFEHLIRDCRRILGDDHLETRAACGNLAAARAKADE